MLRGDNPQISAVSRVLVEVAPDVVLLTGIDTDIDGHAANALAHLLADNGLAFTHTYTALGNAGAPTGFDLDRDGRLGEAEDAQSYGDFRGAGGMVLLSRLPITGITDFSGLLWRALPDSRLPRDYFSADEANVLRLSTNAHWDVVVDWDGAPLHLFASYAASPVFDGPEDRNGLRNADEIGFWRHYLDGRLSEGPPDGPFVILGDLNLDPVDGEGRTEEIVALIADPRIQDPAPRSDGALAARDADHSGDPALDTVDWPDGRPGNLRVDYVLPAATLEVVASGVHWPVSGGIVGEDGASRHALVWVDIRR